MTENKVYSLIGFAKKAGRLKVGYNACLSEIERNKEILCIIANDASDNTKKKIIRKCINKEVVFFEFGDREKMGKLLRKEYVSVICMINKDFIKPVEKYLV